MSQFDESQHRRDSDGKFASKGPAAEADSSDLRTPAESTEDRELDADVERLEKQLEEVQYQLAAARVRQLGRDLERQYGPDATLHTFTDVDDIVYASKVTRSGGRSDSCNATLGRCADELPCAQDVRGGASYESKMRVGDMAQQPYTVPNEVPRWRHDVKPSVMANQQTSYVLDNTGWVDPDSEPHDKVHDALVGLRHYAAANDVDFEDRASQSAETYDDEVKFSEEWDDLEPVAPAAQAVGQPLTGYQIDDPNRPPVDVEVEDARQRWLQAPEPARMRYVNERPAGQFYSAADHRAEREYVERANATGRAAEAEYRDMERRWKDAGQPTTPKDWSKCPTCGTLIDSAEGCPNCG